MRVARMGLPSYFYSVARDGRFEQFAVPLSCVDVAITDRSRTFLSFLFV